MPVGQPLTESIKYKNMKKYPELNSACLLSGEGRDFPEKAKGSKLMLPFFVAVFGDYCYQNNKSSIRTFLCVV